MIFRQIFDRKSLITNKTFRNFGSGKHITVKEAAKVFVIFEFPIFRDRGYDVAEFIGIPQNYNFFPHFNRKTSNTPQIYKISYYYNLYCFDSISLVCGFSIKILGERRFF